jgi:multiple sugar transport system ATP-binding protein
VTVGLRPESLELGGAGIAAEVMVVEELGSDAYAFCMAELAGVERRLIARVDARHPPRRGEPVTLAPIGAEAHLFDPRTGARLGS